MKLTYHEGNNFGDALNPIIFNKYLPNFFDEETNEIFLGIGSILGLKKGFKNTEKIIVFSSGFAGGAPATYGNPPVIDNKYDIICVRGPLTAKVLGIKKSKVITDAALLLYEMDISTKTEKKYKYSFMPHKGSENKFNWKKLIEGIGINYISPTDDVFYVIDEISQTKVMIVEAMHGAIVSDALRVPWIPIRGYPTINKFKWMDYCKSMGLEYKPTELTRLYSESYFKKLWKNKFGDKFFYDSALNVYDIYRNIYQMTKLKMTLNKIKNATPFLSEEAIVQKRCNQLMTKLNELRNRN